MTMVPHIDRLRQEAVEAIAAAGDPLLMAHAMRHACHAGRGAFLAGRIPRKLYATASSPEVGVLGTTGPVQRNR